MKGIVFTEFLEMVEATFGAEVVEQIIDASDLPSGGAYTAVGTYDHNELIRLVGQLSAVTGIAAPDLVRAFGKHLFGRFVTLYPGFFKGVGSAFAFLGRVDAYIHVEVRKLYPDAELPRFECNLLGPGRIELFYRSTRPFADLAEGLIMGCGEHFGERIELRREDHPEGHEGAVRFLLTSSKA